MNEINQNPVFSPNVTPKNTQAVNALDKTQTVDDKKLNAASDTSPETQDKKSESSDKSVESALNNANAYVQNIQRDLVFSVDKDLEQTVIKVVESESGKVIRQIPEDIFLELAKNLETGGDLNLVNASG